VYLNYISILFLRIVFQFNIHLHHRCSTYYHIM